MSNFFGNICIISGVGQPPAITGRLKGKRDECHYLSCGLLDWN